MGVKVAKELLPMKMHYFLFNAATTSALAFVPTLAKQLGFSTVILGTVYTILPFMSMLAKLLFGYIADRYQHHRSIFIFSQIVTAIAFYMIMFIPALRQPSPSVQFHCHGGISELRFCASQHGCTERNLGAHFGTEAVNCMLNCKAESTMWDIVCQDWLTPNSTQCNSSMNKTSPYLDISTSVNMSNIVKLDQCLHLSILDDRGEINGESVVMQCTEEQQYINTSCEIDCNDQFLTNLLAVSPVMKNSDAIGVYQFWFFLFLLIISRMGMAVVVSIGDTICFAILGERHHLYGKQRLWGSVGVGLIAIISGVLMDLFSYGGFMEDYTTVFWITAMIIGFDVLASSKLKLTQTKAEPNILQDIGQMFLSINRIIFFIWCILIGICMALIWQFLFWYLDDLNTHLNGCKNSMKLLQGIAVGIQCFAGEFPIYFLHGRILKKIGHVNAMSLVLFSFGLCFILFSIIKNPWYVLPIELLIGITFGIFYATMVSYASIVAPSGTEATMQGLVGAIFEGIGVSIGSFVCGLLFDYVGGEHTFEIFGVAAFIAFIVHVCLQLFLQFRQAIQTTSQS